MYGCMGVCVYVCVQEYKQEGKCMDNDTIGWEEMYGTFTVMLIIQAIKHFQK